MSRYIDADKAIMYFRKSHKIQTAKIIDHMADSNDYLLGDVVTREQYNQLYDEKLELQRMLEQSQCLNSHLMDVLHELGDDGK